MSAQCQNAEWEVVPLFCDSLIAAGFKRERPNWLHKYTAYFGATRNAVCSTAKNGQVSKITKNAGESIYLKCISSQDLASRIRWKKGTEVIKEARKASFLDLRLEKLTVEAAGAYRCDVRPNWLHKYTAYFGATRNAVCSTAKNGQVSKITKNAGESIYLKCISSQDLASRIRWKKGTEVIKEARKASFLDLRLEKLTVEAAGAYRCDVGEFPYNRTRSQGEFPYNSTSSKGEFPYNRTRSKGEFTYNRTRSQGEFPYNRTRSQDEFPYNRTRSQGEFPYNRTRSQGEFPYNRTRSQDEFPYNRTRSQGEFPYNRTRSQGEFPYNRTRSQGPPIITSRSNVHEAKVGSDVAVACVATGSPKPTVEWSSQPLPQCRSLSRAKIVNQGSTAILTIESVTKEDEGIYCCVARNSNGQSKPHIVILSVSYHKRILPPHVSPFSQVVVSTTDSTTTLICAVENAPQKYTTVFWTLNSKQLTDGGRYKMATTFSTEVEYKRLLLERATMTLIIKHVTTQDSGEYQCGVVTHIGSGHAEIQLVTKGNAIAARGIFASHHIIAKQTNSSNHYQWVNRVQGFALIWAIGEKDFSFQGSVVNRNRELSKLS
ncbi:predicted protein [Nematostella vectensis]|uniref:Ig-like domain-containing protein n=1 Tax=Nematostella vectensis TaxID=45351 RepID=A7SM80_NEMVE|nr:predicted protein [Nematostella vectensis]|eukprot:XP_001627285.1 predicted protein [Nematostella vectensis]